VVDQRLKRLDPLHGHRAHVVLESGQGLAPRVEDAELKHHEVGSDHDRRGATVRVSTPVGYAFRVEAFGDQDSAIA
jgi:hypothetical protein